MSPRRNNATSSARLQLLRHRVDGLRDPGRRDRRPLLPDVQRIVEHVPRQLANRRRHRRAEEQRLAACRHVLENLANLRQKPHVEHPIGFVEHEVLDPIELRVRPAQMIEQPPGRRDEHVHAAAKRVLLRARADAAEHRGASDGRVHGEILHVGQNLRGQLARRDEHERARRAARLADDAVKNRQQERRGLAAAGFGGGEHVAAGERAGNRGSLDRSGSNETHLAHGTKQAGMEAERGKWHASIVCRRLAPPLLQTRVRCTISTRFPSSRP